MTFSLLQRLIFTQIYQKSPELFLFICSMDMKYVENFSGGKAVLFIQGEIGVNEKTGEGVDGFLFAKTIEYLQHEDSVNEIEVKINCYGGVLIQAVSIFDAIRNSKKQCNTVIEGIAASSGGLVAMAGHKRKMNDFSRLMIHAPSIPMKAKEEMSENTVKMLSEFQDLIAELLTSNSKFSKEAIVKMIEKETWFTSKDALSGGFIDEVISTGRDFTEVFNSLEFSKGDLSSVVNKLSNNQKSTFKMETIKNLLGLDSSVSEAIVENKIKEALNLASVAKTDLGTEKEAHEETKGKLEKLQNKLDEVNDSAAVAFVENAIKDGKLSADKKEELTAQAKNDLEGFKTLVDSIPAPAARITDSIEGTKVVENSGEVVDGKLDGKTLREIEKSDPSKVTNLLKNEPEKYKALFKAEYGTEPA